MKVKIYKGLPQGELNAPSSKSYSHRYLIASGLANNKSTISNVYYSNDILATLNCLSSFGCDFVKECDKVTFNESKKEVFNVFDCDESGSTLRFMIPIALTKFDKVLFKGKEKLLERGISVYEKVFANKGISITKNKEGIVLEGKLTSGIYEIEGSMSSQFISGLLFALPLLDGDSEIRILPPIHSKNYIDMTLEVLSNYHIKYDMDGNTIKVKGNQEYVAFDYEIEGDYSNAAFLDAFNYLNSSIKVSNLNKDSLQGDKVYLEYYEKLDKENVTLDISNCIDLGPVLFMMASLKHGATFVGTERLKIKESDRALSMKQELEKVGVKIDVYENEVKVYKSNLHKPTNSFDSHNDHRIAMALSLLSTMFDIEITNAEAVNKSYPNYFVELEKVGVRIEYETK